MGSFLDFVGMVAELFTWIGIGAGILCFLALVLLRVIEGRWIETDAVVIEDAQEMRLRWMSTSGLHERRVTPEERDRVSSPDGLRLYYRQRTPGRTRFDFEGDGEKTLRLLGLIFLAVGGVALLVSGILLFVSA